jgi:hypothetical protein
MNIECFPFTCKESDLPKEIQRENTYYFDDIPEDHFENIDTFLKKVGVHMFEGNESFRITKIYNDMFQELE